MDWSSLEVIFNRWEAGLWFAFALVCLGACVPRRTKMRRQLLALAAAFAAFGVSDIIESHTGAWWRPWWLLVLKAACLGVIAPCAWQLWKARPRGKARP